MFDHFVMSARQLRCSFYTQASEVCMLIVLVLIRCKGDDQGNVLVQGVGQHDQHAVQGHRLDPLAS